MHPTGGNDRQSFLSALEPVANSSLKVVRAIISHRVVLGLGPQISDSIEVERARRRERNMVAAAAVESARKELRC